MQKVIEKIVAPSNRSNVEPYGTAWIADLEQGKQVWFQTSKETDSPKWVRLGDMYEHCALSFRHKDNDVRFAPELSSHDVLRFYTEGND